MTPSPYTLVFNTDTAPEVAVRPVVGFVIVASNVSIRDEVAPEGVTPLPQTSVSNRDKAPAPANLTLPPESNIALFKSTTSD